MDLFEDFLKLLLKKSLRFVIISIFLGGQLSFSQTYFFDNYSVAEGLEQSKVYAIVQDSMQYIWLGTKAGVSRFDGLNFSNYTIENGLAPGGVRVLFIDKKNKLWMGHEGGGISRYSNKVFEKVLLPDSIINSNITSIVEDFDHQIWITTELNGAVVVRNPEMNQNDFIYEHFLKGKRLSDQVFGSMAASDSNLYFITNVGIKKYNKTNNNFETYMPNGMFTYFITTVMYEDNKGNFWFGTYNGGLYKHNRIENRFEFFDTKSGLAANWINTLTEDHAGNIWVGHWSLDKSTGGITRINPAGGTKIFNSSNGLHDNQIWCIKEDLEGNILIGTTEHGLDIYKGEEFVSITTNNGLKNNQVSAILQDKIGRIWFGTDEGISIYNTNNGQNTFIHFNQKSNLISNQTRLLKLDENDNVWIGTADQGIMLYNTHLNKFVGQPAINSYLPYQNISKEVTALEIAPKGHLWIGTFEGLVEYDINQNEYITTLTQGTGLAGNWITTLFIDSKNRLWIGSKAKGLVYKDKDKFTFIEAAKDLTINCVTEDRDGKIWVGTESRGVLVINKDSIQQYSITDGLLANLINLILVDLDNNVYIGSRGLNKIDQKTGKILSYTERTGFTGIETKKNAACTDNKGNLWFGTVNGAIKCNPKANDFAKKEPTINIDQMIVNRSAIKMIPGMKLSSFQNDISFGYLSISLRNPEALIYQVKLEGLQDLWQDMKNEHSILYNKLPPGRYTFKVRARNDLGIWTENPVEFSFRILPPFYKRGFFIVSIVLIVLIAIIAYIKIRERTLIREKRILESKVKERTEALSDANDQLSMKNKDILDSINYAKRIQFAILPPDIPFDNTFILFKPKDIVSGDFYWLNSAGGKEFLAAVDCTGHGVPGAFMSFIGYTSLNKIIIEEGIYQPASILNHLNEEVAKTLHQTGEDIVNDGMDIALISYTPKTWIVEYAGAFNPLIIIRNGEIIETKADRFAIGRSTDNVKEFTNHSLKLEPGDSIYIFSDGYADQFGGPEEKKFKNANLKELLASIADQNPDKQKELLDRSFEDWKAEHEQIDDVLLIGRRFNKV